MSRRPSAEGASFIRPPLHVTEQVSVPISIVEGESLNAGEGSSLRGLLISLLTIFDINHNKTLTQEEFTQAATPLGFDTGPGAWEQVCNRFGDLSSKKRSTADTAEEDEGGRSIDLTLVGSYFANRYDPVLEELLRRLLTGIMNASARNLQLERRLRVVEEHLEQTSMREQRERQHKINQTLRRWKHR